MLYIHPPSSRWSGSPSTGARLVIYSTSSTFATGIVSELLILCCFSLSLKAPCIIYLLFEFTSLVRVPSWLFAFLDLCLEFSLISHLYDELGLTSIRGLRTPSQRIGLGLNCAVRPFYSYDGNSTVVQFRRFTTILVLTGAKPPARCCQSHDEPMGYWSGRIHCALFLVHCNLRDEIGPGEGKT